MSSGIEIEIIERTDNHITALDVALNNVRGPAVTSCNCASQKFCTGIDGSATKLDNTIY